MTNERKRCIEQVEAAVCSDRNIEYGNPEDNFLDIAKMWNTLMGNKLSPDHEFHPHDVALMMVAVKLSRAKTSPEKLDHYIDIAGYAACGYACIKAYSPSQQPSQDPSLEPSLESNLGTLYLRPGESVWHQKCTWCAGQVSRAQGEYYPSCETCGRKHRIETVG